MFRQLWNDQAGALLSAELVLVGTILVIGVIAGLTSLRDAVVTELADLAEGIAQLDQSYSIPGVTGVGSWTASSEFIDAPDPGDGGDVTASHPRCIVICATVGTGEGSVTAGTTPGSNGVPTETGGGTTGPGGNSTNSGGNTTSAGGGLANTGGTTTDTGGGTGDTGGDTTNPGGGIVSTPTGGPNPAGNLNTTGTPYGLAPRDALMHRALGDTAMPSGGEEDFAAALFPGASLTGPGANSRSPHPNRSAGVDLGGI